MISDLLYRLRALFRRKSMEAELDEELRVHFEHQVEKYVQSGLPVEESKRRVRLEFGGLDQVKEECRDARGVNFVSKQHSRTSATACASYAEILASPRSWC